MKKVIHIRELFLLFVFILGFASAPSVTIACGKNPEKTCCKRMKSMQHSTEKSTKKDCCKKDKRQSNDKSEDCGGKCGNESCQCPTSHLSFTIPISFEITQIYCVFANEKQQFQNVNIYPSSGFYSIWSPPNIG